MKNALIVLLVICATLFNTSCLKKQNLNDDNLGPAIEAQALTEAISTGLGPYSYKQIKKGELSSFILTQTIQDIRTMTIEQQDLTIRDVAVTDDFVKLDSFVTKLKYNGNQTATTSREWTDYWPPASVQQAEERPTYLFQNLEMLAFYSCVNSGKYPETCHQLQVTDFKYRVPVTAASQHNCPDIYECYVDARQIEFDAVSLAVIDKDGKPKRTHYTIIVSKDVPFLSKMLMYCTRSIYEMRDSQKILADVCATVNSYAAGQD
jgi:hypothetical protein